MDLMFISRLKIIENLISILTEKTQNLTNNKQDKLIGNPGQFVSFNDENEVYSVFPSESNKLKVIENDWGNLGANNILPTTNNWIMSNGKSPTLASNYDFSANFTSVWEAFSCFFDENMINFIKGKTMKIGVTKLVSDSCRLELVVNGNSVAEITNTLNPFSVEYTFPVDIQSTSLRVICFSNVGDLSCSFDGVYMYDSSEEDSENVYFQVRLKLQNNLPIVGIKGSFYITEQGKIYFTGADGNLLSLN